jgi:hypothetical protein
MNNNNNYKFIVWNNGDKPERSTKRPFVEIDQNSITPSISNNNESATTYITPTIYRESNNKRQDSSDKISERYLIEQRGLNPYISHSTSYANDVSFLIPKSSNEHPKNRIEFS